MLSIMQCVIINSNISSFNNFIKIQTKAEQWKIQISCETNCSVKYSSYF